MLRVNKLIYHYLENKEVFLIYAYKYMASHVTENCVISPIHAQTLLCLMVFAGEGEAIQEIKAKLGVRRGNLDKLKSSIRAAMTALSTRVDNCGTTVTSTIFLNNNYKVEHNFGIMAMQIFDCMVKNVSFTEFPEIYKVMKENCAMDEHTKMILDNELYFNARWTTDFRVRGKLGFHGSSGPVPVPSLHSRARYNYCDHRFFNAELIEIKLAGEHISMVIVLPHQLNGLSAVEDKIDQIFRFNNYQNKLLDLHIPMFRADGQVDFKALFQEFGVKKIFTEGEANLNLMCTDQNDLFVNDFFQMNIFKLSEISASSGRQPILHSEHMGYEHIMGAVPAEAITSESVVVNHPFAFFIKYHDIILFVGRIMEHKLVPPEEEQEGE